MHPCYTAIAIRTPLRSVVRLSSICCTFPTQARIRKLKQPDIHTRHTGSITPINGAKLWTKMVKNQHHKVISILLCDFTVNNIVMYTVKPFQATQRGTELRFLCPQPTDHILIWGFSGMLCACLLLSFHWYQITPFRNRGTSALTELYAFQVGVEPAT